MVDTEGTHRCMHQEDNAENGAEAVRKWKREKFRVQNIFNTKCHFEHIRHERVLCREEICEPNDERGCGKRREERHPCVPCRIPCAHTQKMERLRCKRNYEECEDGRGEACVVPAKFSPPENNANELCAKHNRERDNRQCPKQYVANTCRNLMTEALKISFCMRAGYERERC